MVMSDPHGTSVDSPAAPDQAELGGESDATRQWLALVSEFGADVAGPLTAALERIDSLTASGRITRADLRALREEVQQARQAGMLGQQLTILASGGLRHSPERLVLDEAVQSVLGRRANDMTDRTVTVVAASERSEVIVDPTLLFSLLNTLFDWALGNAAGRCEFKTGPGSAQGYVQLECRFEANLDEGTLIDPTDPVRPRRLNALTWRMLEQTSAAMGLVVRQQAETNGIGLTLQFIRAAPEAQPPIEFASAGVDQVDSQQPRPLAGTQVLVISSRRDMRVQIRDTLRHMGLMIDFVSSVNEAAQFCDSGAPDAVIIESIQRGERFARFREELSAQSPGVAFIEIVEHGQMFEKSGFGGVALGRVGRDVIDSALPAALLHELSKSSVT